MVLNIYIYVYFVYQFLLIYFNIGNIFILLMLYKFIIKDYKAIIFKFNYNYIYYIIYIIK